MPRGSRIVDFANVVQDVEEFYIAKDGVVARVNEGYVAEYGRARQFWPKTTPPADGVQIIMDTATEESYDVSTIEARALCNFDARTASLILSSPTGNVTIPVLAPAPRSSGQFHFKFEPISGEFVTHFDEGGAAYNPDMTEFDGATGYYSKNQAYSGNLLTFVCRFQRDSFTGDRFETCYRSNAGGSGNQRLQINVYSSDWTTETALQDRIRVQINNASGTTICMLSCNFDICDGDVHTIFIAFNGTTGAATFYIDGSNADDVTYPGRVAPTTGTLPTASDTMSVGANTGVNFFFGGRLGFLGLSNTYLTWSGFMEGDGTPIFQDTTDWPSTGWGAQPLFWNETGAMNSNDGSAGNMTANGTITPWSPPVVSGPQWHDVFEDGTLGLFENYLPNYNTPGQVTGQATFSLAEDDGGGSPDLGTVVAKTIDFIAEVPGNRICMTSIPWDLNNVEVNETAEVFVLTIPEGWWDEANQYSVPFAAINGEFGYPKGGQESEIYACQWSPSVTVQVDLVSGTVQGAATGVPLTTDVRRIWYIRADDPDEIVEATIDVTITDGVETVTKRVVMRAEQTTDVTDPGSEMDSEFTRYDLIFEEKEVPDGDPAVAATYIEVMSDGTVNGKTNTVDPYAAFPQNWNALAPGLTDPQNYECRVTQVDGDALTAGTLDTWFNCSSQRTWGYAVAAVYGGGGITVTTIKQGNFTLEIREVGRPDTMLSKPFQLYAIARSVAPAGPLP